MGVFNHPEFDHHDSIHFFEHPASGLKAIIAIHSTALGPAAGGCRRWAYASDDLALTDALAPVARHDLQERRRRSAFRWRQVGRFSRGSMRRSPKRSSKRSGAPSIRCRGVTSRPRTSASPSRTCVSCAARHRTYRDFRRAARPPAVTPLRGRRSACSAASRQPPLRGSVPTPSRASGLPSRASATSASTCASCFTRRERS